MPHFPTLRCAYLLQATHHLQEDFVYVEDPAAALPELCGMKAIGLRREKKPVKLTNDTRNCWGPAFWPGQGRGGPAGRKMGVGWTPPWGWWDLGQTQARRNKDYQAGFA